MSIEDEARAEAEKRHQHSGPTTQRLARREFTAGYIAGASRQPSEAEVIAYAIYGRKTGNLKWVEVLDEEEAREQGEFYDVVPLVAARTARGEQQ